MNPSSFYDTASGQYAGLPWLGTQYLLEAQPKSGFAAVFSALS
jgi:hypothetical protein